MFAITEFRAQMVRNGYNQKTLASAIGITPKTLYLKMKSGKFSTDEIEKIMKLLDISDPVPVFFAEEQK